jgi:hypothetical protein
MPTPTSAPTDIWAEPERPQTLADISFASTSIDNIEFPDDMGPVAYQANRAAMASNAAGELAELEARNQQTTSYPTISCVAGPMSPEYNMHNYGGTSCDVENMQERSHAITPYATDGTALLPQFNQQRSDACAAMEMDGVGMSSSEPIGYAPHVYSYPKMGPRTPAMRAKKNKKHNTRIEPKKTIPFKDVPLRTLASVRGALYDMKHFGDLPPAQSGAPPSTVTYYALTRDGRTPYLLISITFALALMAIILIVRSSGKQKSS